MGTPCDTRNHVVFPAAGQQELLGGLEDAAQMAEESERQVVEA